MMYLDPSVEIMQWGPVPMKLYYVSGFEVGIFIKFRQFYPGYGWPKSLVLFNKNHKGVWLNEFPDMRKNGGKIFTELVLNKERVKKIKQDWKSSEEVLFSTFNELDNIDFQKLTDSQLIETAHKLQDVYSTYLAHSTIAELSNYGSIAILKDALKKDNVAADDVPLLLESLSAPEELSFYQEEEIDLVESNNMDEHIKKFHWLKNSYDHVEYLNKEFFEQRKKEVEPQVKSIVQQGIEQTKKRKEALVEKYSLSEQTVTIAHALADTVVWQDKRKKVVLITLHYLDRILNELSNRLPYKKEELVRYVLDEIIEVFKDPSKKLDIKERHSGVGAYLVDGLQIVSSAETEENWQAIVEKELSGDVTELKGTVASKGKESKVKGTVKVVFDAQQAEHFNKGDILVTPMTTPEFIFVMKKASAIITDTGGLTSHAAIVSRELNIPCIVNTTLATKAFKDGDVIEVDAEKGVVKKI